MPKFEVSKGKSSSHTGNKKAPSSFTIADLQSSKRDDLLKEQLTQKGNQMAAKRPPRRSQQPKQNDKLQQQQQQQQQSKVQKVNQNAKEIDTTTTATSTPSRRGGGGGGGLSQGKSPMRMVIGTTTTTTTTTTSSSGNFEGSPLSFHGGVHRGGGGGELFDAGLVMGGQHGHHQLLAGYPAPFGQSFNQQWPPPPYHPFYSSKATSYQYRNQAHQSKVEFTDVRQMESTLYQLLTDFHLGKLQAFGDGVTFENMIKVREQQENLARLHFELNLQQSSKHSFENDAFFSDSPSKVNTIIGKPFSKSNMIKLISNLQNLCKSIERLQWKNSNELEFN